tara:strand:+ start:375 stop:599 length:225 start_codon:yes stop_codon:yes gene_type:complete
MSYITRSGRQVKKPVLYEPKEKCNDDYEDDDDEDEGDDIFSSDESESESDEEDADENGNLKGFVVSDSDEEDDA